MDIAISILLSIAVNFIALCIASAIVFGGALLLKQVIRAHKQRRRSSPLEHQKW